ncbi:sporulation protein [Dactylosporangium sp. AC04546]|uniref:sporulation protein n=1 Tax=Dactylosporangium sp. AC04546 TaxID=2862460 RepID=UPI001EDDF01C|nr:sporulation protein [Dactylosporangium sp. AC04546]WVK86485.1 sporulation protein [Dactylosporangium sp. AC04546]
MVFKKLLAGLGFGGVEVDTVLSPQPATPGGALTGQVNLRAKGDTDISGIHLLLVATGQLGEVELARHTVSGPMNVTSGATPSIPFTMAVPSHAPFTVLYGQQLPGINIGVRTEVAVASGSAKGDFDPARLDASPAHQHIMDALGTIGCRFVRNELRPGVPSGVDVSVAQAITFLAPVPEGQQPGPHIPQIVFLFTGTHDGMTVIAELAGRPGAGDKHHLSTGEMDELSGTEDGWIGEVDGWVSSILQKLSQPAPVVPGAFLNSGAPGHSQSGYAQPGYGRPAYGSHGHQSYAYNGHGQHGGYKYGGYQRKPGMGVGGMVAAGVGGAALGFLGGMVLSDMIGDAMSPDVADAAGAAGMGDAGFGEAGVDDGGFDDFGGDEF